MIDAQVDGSSRLEKPTHFLESLANVFLLSLFFVCTDLDAASSDLQLFAEKIQQCSVVSQFENVVICQFTLIDMYLFDMCDIIIAVFKVQLPNMYSNSSRMTYSRRRTFCGIARAHVFGFDSDTF